MKLKDFWRLINKPIQREFDKEFQPHSEREQILVEALKFYADYEDQMWSEDTGYVVTATGTVHPREIARRALAKAGIVGPIGY